VSVKIRLKRLGKIRAPHYRIVVADSRTKRDGRVIEEIGRYVPTADPSVIEVKSDRAQYWLSVGAQPTEQVTALLKLTGDWGMFKGDKDAKNTVRMAEPKVAFQVDAKKKPVLRPKVEKAVKAEVVADVAAEVAAEVAADDIAGTPEVAAEATTDIVAEAAESAEAQTSVEAVAEEVAAEEPAAAQAPAEEPAAE
jgi:small subunit ribosomal protein S16